MGETNEFERNNLKYTENGVNFAVIFDKGGKWQASSGQVALAPQKEPEKPKNRQYQAVLGDPYIASSLKEVDALQKKKK
ncbi:MAG: hypothetical protein LBT30_04320 [Clostridiales bacterium]|jgi:hypothetical protein|nr:hypothetical protein [Clostridiales bacterium]